ncbi:MAG: DUF1572 family protein [Bacteroidia bacterium]
MKNIEKTTETEYLRVIRFNFDSQKSLAEKAFEQLSEIDFHITLDEESNSISILIQHMSGNMISRFTDFLTSDGEKPDRNRDAEFEEKNISRQRLLEKWEAGWKVVFAMLEQLEPGDLLKTVYIRNEPHSVIEALNRQVAHYGYHVGQIVFLAKHLRNKNWKSLSIPKAKGKDVKK